MNHFVPFSDCYPGNSDPVADAEAALKRALPLTPDTSLWTEAEQRQVRAAYFHLEQVKLAEHNKKKWAR